MARWHLKGRTASHNICLTGSSKLWKHLICFILVINSGLCDKLTLFCFPSGVLLSRGYAALHFFVLDLLHLDVMSSAIAWQGKGQMWIQWIAVLWLLEVCEMFQDSIKKYIVNNVFASIVLVHIYKRHTRICGDSPFVSLIFRSIF